jgi:pimeloyl-ACP methyl ester carboxylesterase
LSVGYHAIAIDLVGFGMSDKPWRTWLLYNRRI